MSISAQLVVPALTAYVVGIVLFLLFCRDFVLGGWFQTLVTALLWPVLAVLLFVEFNPTRRLQHWLAHRLHINGGRLHRFDDGGVQMLGFKCDGCGEVQHSFVARAQ